MTSLEIALNAAIAKLQKLASFGAPYSARTSAESKYGEVYQQMVKAGERPQLRAKYRHD